MRSCAVPRTLWKRSFHITYPNARGAGLAEMGTGRPCRLRLATGSWNPVVLFLLRNIAGTCPSSRANVHQEEPNQHHKHTKESLTALRSLFPYERNKIDESCRKCEGSMEERQNPKGGYNQSAIEKPSSYPENPLYGRSHQFCLLPIASSHNEAQPPGDVGFCKVTRSSSPGDDCDTERCEFDSH